MSRHGHHVTPWSKGDILFTLGFREKHDMIKFCLAATAALGIMTGVGLAQTSTSTTTSTQSTAPAAPPTFGTSMDSSSQRTVDSNGVVIDKQKTYTSGTGITPNGDMSTTRKSTESTTVR
jgi:hypothetical protein